MTRFDFEMLCGEMLLEPALVLENEAIADALRKRDDATVKRLLKEEF